MEHFIKGIVPLRQYLHKPKYEEQQIKFSVFGYQTKALKEQFLQGNVPLRNLINEKRYDLMDIQFIEVNDFFSSHTSLISFSII